MWEAAALRRDPPPPELRRPLATYFDKMSGFAGKTDRQIVNFIKAA
jgi:hypothetical protein